jgi:uncharacterized protein YoxC
VSQSVDTTRSAVQDFPEAVSELDATARRLTAPVDRFEV